jgi:cytochrome P450
MLLNFAITFPTTGVATNLLLDLVSKDCGASCLQMLREEIKLVDSLENGPWNEKKLDRLCKLDSAIKETLRMHGPLSYAIPRKVSNIPSNTRASTIHQPPI